MKIVVTTSDRYMFLLEGFAYLFNKFWGRDENVTVVCYNKPKFKLPSNFELVSIGKDRGANYWCEDFANYLETLDNRYITHLMEDQWLYNYTRLDNYDLLCDLCYEDNKVARAMLHSAPDIDYPGSTKYHKSGDTVIYKIPQVIDYKLSIGNSIWKVDYLINNLRKFRSPWDFELGSRVTFNDGFEHIGVNTERTIKVQEVSWRKFGLNHIFLNWFSKELVEEVKLLGFVDNAMIYERGYNIRTGENIYYFGGYDEKNSPSN